MDILNLPKETTRFIRDMIEEGIDPNSLVELCITTDIEKCPDDCHKTIKTKKDLVYWVCSTKESAD